ncbi:pilus assembly protein TadG-related protein [Devosia sp.]|uniref:TadE/TadG family type IV pilus assembly protein n=1 Tax=Devosia sp. TaxID=1871048 RepID=UPI0032644C16
MDQRGVFGIIFAILAVVLVAFSGAVVDFVSLQQTKTRMQVALDAAALALQNRVFDVPLNAADIKAKALALTIERVDDARVTITMDNPTINVTDGSLLLTARMDMPTIFVSLVGVQHMGATVLSQATRKKLALEVVFVLDNSGSMQNSARMTNLKTAAACATNILFYSAVDATTCAPASGATLVSNVKVGVVPFTIFVNVDPTNSTQSWIDKTGASPTAKDNFDSDDNDSTAFAGPVNRLALFASVGEAWRGCVEARPHTASTGGGAHYLDTDDTAPVAGNTLFVPQFSPDLPDTIASVGSGYQSYLSDNPAACKVTGNCQWTETKTKCSSYSSCSGGTVTNAYVLTGVNKGSLSCTCSSTAPWLTDSGTSTYSGSGSNRTYSRVRTCGVSYDAQGLSDRELQERLCKYNGAVTGSAFSTGPNADCTREPILPLTSNPANVQQTITDMIADGGTNIHEGAAWGFRVLSPGAPFTQGAAYGTATKKVMIIMTDGENTAYNVSGNSVQNAIRAMNGSIWYSAYGWPYNLRLGSLTNPPNADMVTEMNNRTVQTCTNAKESGAGIDIYTIGLATASVTQSTQAVVETMLKNCASSTDKAYFPATSAELTPVFKSIAAQLSALRLAQ